MMSGVEDAKRQAALAAEAKRAGIPEWQAEMARAVPNDLIAGIVNDNRSPPGPSSIAGKPTTSAEKGTGWLKGTPIEPPPGVEILDRVMDVQDALDRRERERQLKEER